MEKNISGIVGVFFVECIFLFLGECLAFLSSVLFGVTLQSCSLKSVMFCMGALI